MNIRANMYVRYPLIPAILQTNEKKPLHPTAAVTLSLSGIPGEAQADFGEVQCLEGGELKTFKFLCLTLPSSNAGYAQTVSR